MMYSSTIDSGSPQWHCLVTTNISLHTGETRKYGTYRVEQSLGAANVSTGGILSTSNFFEAYVVSSKSNSELSIACVRNGSFLFSTVTSPITHDKTQVYDMKIYTRSYIAYPSDKLPWDVSVI